MDDGESTKRQHCELECENGGERDRSEEAPVDGNGSVMETLAQDRSQLDQVLQHECADSHQRTNAVTWPEWATRRCARRPRDVGDIWRWRQLLWKEVERDGWAGPHPKLKIYRWEEDLVSSEVSEVCWKRRGVRRICSSVYRMDTCCSESRATAAVREIWENFDLDVAILKTHESCHSRHGGQCAPSEVVEWRRLVASNGMEWWWWLRVASIGVDWLLRRLATNGYESVRW